MNQIKNLVITRIYIYIYILGLYLMHYHWLLVHPIDFFFNSVGSIRYTFCFFFLSLLLYRMILSQFRYILLRIIVIVGFFVTFIFSTSIHPPMMYSRICFIFLPMTQW